MFKPFRKIWTFLLAVWARVGDGHFGLIAAGVAFYAMFAVFPGMAAVVAIWGMVADPVVIAGYLEVVERFMPPDAKQLVHDQVMGRALGVENTLVHHAVRLQRAEYRQLLEVIEGVD